MDDRTLLERAAKAAGYDDAEWSTSSSEYGPCMWSAAVFEEYGSGYWNPLLDDAQALRLAVKLNMTVRCYMGTTVAQIGTPGLKNAYEEVTDHADPYAATRRAIVRAAAEIGGE